jgi:hypothetical protein
VILGARRLLESEPTVVVESLDDEGLVQLKAQLPNYSFHAIDRHNFLCPSF